MRFHSFGRTVCSKRVLSFWQLVPTLFHFHKLFLITWCNSRHVFAVASSFSVATNSSYPLLPKAEQIISKYSNLSSTDRKILVSCPLQSRCQLYTCLGAAKLQKQWFWTSRTLITINQLGTKYYAPQIKIGVHMNPLCTLLLCTGSGIYHVYKT